MDKKMTATKNKAEYETLTIMAKDILMFDQINGHVVTYLRKIPLDSHYSGIVILKLEREELSYTKAKGHYVSFVHKKKQWYDAYRDEVKVIRKVES